MAYNPSQNTIKGKFGEKIAEQILDKFSIKIIQKNFRFMGREVDIIARDGDILCFVEVKAWSDVPKEELSRAVGLRKQDRIIKAAQCFINLHPEFSDLNCRFDVLFIRTNSTEYEYIPHAFDASK